MSIKLDIVFFYNLYNLDIMDITLDWVAAGNDHSYAASILPVCIKEEEKEPTTNLLKKITMFRPKNNIELRNFLDLLNKFGYTYKLTQQDYEIFRLDTAKIYEYSSPLIWLKNKDNTWYSDTGFLWYCINSDIDYKIYNFNLIDFFRSIRFSLFMRT